MSHALLFVLFFLSGASGLIFEILWVRLIGVSMGAGPASTAVIIGLFMGGLAAGSLLAGRVRGGGLREYGLAELGVAAWGAATPAIVGLGHKLFDMAFSIAPSSPALALLLRIAGAAIVVLPPTLLMGLSFPLLGRQATAAAPRLYAWNTAGAVFGCLLSGLVLIPLAGLTVTRLVAVAICASVGLAALAAARRTGACGRERERPARKVSEAVDPMLLSLVFVWGFATLASEIACERSLALAVGSSVYSVTLVVAAFIGGLAAGSAYFARRGPSDGWRWLCTTGICAGISTALLILLLGELPAHIVPFITGFGRHSYLALVGAETFLVGALLFLPTFFMGASMPLACALAGDAAGLGPLYAASTVGSIAGSIGAGIVLIPLLGLRDTLLLGAALFLLCGGLAAARLSGSGKQVRHAWFVAPGLVLLAALPAWDPAVMASGPFLYAGVYADAAAKSGFSMKRVMTSFDKVLFYREGACATVSVRQDASGFRSLAVNGKVDASSGLDMITQVMVGHVPLLFGASGGSALLVGLGSGVTLGAMEAHPASRIDCLEISPEVVEASHFFDNVNGRPLEDPRVDLIVGDARTYVRLSPEKYDAICSEPSNPWVAGMASLFTREHFAACRERLAPGGVICQWVQAYSLSVEDFRSIVSTFMDVFPGATLWEAMEGVDYMLVAREDGAPLDFRRAREAFSRPQVQASLDRVGIGTPELLVKRFVMGPAELRRFAGGAPVHRDDLPRLAYTAPLALLRDTGGQIIVALAPLQGGLEEAFTFAGPEGRERVKRAHAARRLGMRAWNLAAEGQVPEALRLYRQAVSEDPQDTRVRSALGKLLLDSARSHKEAGELAAAKVRFEEYLELEPADLDIRNDYGVLLARMGENGRAREIYRVIIERRPDHLPALRNLALAAYEQDDLDEAIGSYESLCRQNPGDALALNNLGICYMKRERYPEALRSWRQALKADRGLERARENIRIIEFLGYK